MTKAQRIKYETVYRPAYEAFMKVYPFTLENLDGEEWRTVPECEDYQISNFGRVKSLKNGKEKIMKPRLQKLGYLSVGIWINGNQKNIPIHRLVAQKFISNTKQLPAVDHIDGHKFNCCASNLRWVTYKENTSFAYELGLNKVGEEHQNAKLTNEQVVYIRENADKLSIYELSKMFGVDRATISFVQLGKTYRNVGGQLRESLTSFVPLNTRNQIRAEYQEGVRGHGLLALSKKYGIGKATVFNIIKEGDKND